MTGAPDLLHRPLAHIARALRARRTSAVELTEAALARHDEDGERLHAYVHWDPEAALSMARRADAALSAGGPVPPLCGIPLSVKDLYGVEGMPTWAGTARRLPRRWEREGWLVGRVREQGAVIVGKTHTVELAFGAVGTNAHHGTPRNPWDPVVHRVPGGSSSGAGVSLLEGSALVALGTDTGGSLRIPAAMTGTVGHKTTRGRWPTDGVVPLSHTLDTVGALTRTVADALWFFDAVEGQRSEVGAGSLRLAVPSCDLWWDCPPDMAGVLRRALDRLADAGVELVETDGDLLDRASRFYLERGVAGIECRAFLEAELPGWLDVLDPVVGRRIEGAGAPGDPSYRAALEERERLEEAAAALFAEAPLLALPACLVSPPPVDDLVDLDRYLAVNREALRATSPANVLGLTAVSLPAGLDDAGMPVGLQLVAAGGADRRLLVDAVTVEGVVGGILPVEGGA